MKKLLSLTAATLVLATSAGAFAYDKPADSGNPKATLQQVAMVNELKDGTKIDISADGSVSTVNPDGSKTPAPDGTLTLKDGSTLTVKDGKKSS